MSKMNELEELQNTLQEIYSSNLNFFKEEFSVLYQKIIEFEKSKIQNYSLEFIENQFQLIDLKNQTNLYKINPFEDSINRINKFEMSSAFSLIKLEEIPKRNHYENEINAYEFVNEYIKEFGTNSLNINKFIFIGTLLGVHINDFHKAMDCKSYLIIEPNIEIFRLSMFLTDYKILSEKVKLFFAINDSEQEFESTVQNFLNEDFQLNNFIHFEKANESYDYFVNNLTILFNQNSQMRYPFSEYLLSIKRGYKYFLNSGNKILNISKSMEILKNEKVLFLGAGPSLGKKIEWLYLNQKKFIIVASSAVLKYLQILDIVPDIILVIDGQKKQILDQFDVNEHMYKNSIILSTFKIDEDVYKKIESDNTFYLQNSIEIFQECSSLNGVTVGDIGIDLILRFGAKELYLLGIDAAIDSISGKTHIGTHLSSKRVNLKNKNNGNTNFGESIIYVKGNLGKEVPTFYEYKEMIEEINLRLLNLKKDIKIFNLGTGAFFENTIPLDYKKLKFMSENIEKNQLQIKIKKVFKTICKKSLNENDKDRIANEKNILMILNKLQTDTFFDEVFKLNKEFPSSLVLNIFISYYKLISPYLFFIKNKSIANQTFEIQLNILLKEFNTLFDRI